MAAWSPDGRKIAFLLQVATLADGTNVYSLFVATAGGSSPPRELPLPILLGSGPTSSTDGAWIAVSGHLPTDQQWDVWIVRPDGSGALDLTRTPDQSESFPAWY